MLDNPHPSPAVAREILLRGPREAYDHLIAESNNQLLRGPDLAGLENGGDLARQRCDIYDGLMAHWAKQQLDKFGYDRPFAVVGLGGTGRREMSPCSDTDYAFLFDDSVENNEFLLELQRQCIHTDEFKNNFGFSGETLPFNFDDIQDLELKQLNSFIDMRAIYDPTGLADKFRARIQNTYDPFEHFLLITKAWRNQWGQLNSKNEQLDHFDIKADGLRAFQAGIWTLAGREFCHSHEIHDQLDDPRVLDDYHFLIRIRSFVHLIKGTKERPTATGSHPEDILLFDDFTKLGLLAGPDQDEKTRFVFAIDVRARFLEATKRIDHFTWGVIGNELRTGRIIRPGSAIVLGSGGLRDTSKNRNTDWDKSRAALATLLAAQRYDLPIDPYTMETSFEHAGDWIVPVPELADLFYEPRGSIADSLKFLSQMPNVMARLFPGYAAFECSIDERVLAEQKCLRGALVREKLRMLEQILEEGRRMFRDAVDPEIFSKPGETVSGQIEAALLDHDQVAAVQLALTTKRLPVTPDDLKDREDPNLALHERFSSGFSEIAIDQYYNVAFANCRFNQDTLDLTQFLVDQRGAFKRYSASNLVRAKQVDRIVEICDNDVAKMRALYVFTIADRAGWKSPKQNPSRWFNIHELYEEARLRFNPNFNPSDALSRTGFDQEQLAIYKDFGPELAAGGYRETAIKFASYLFRLKDDADSGEYKLPPRATQLRIGTSTILGVAAHDYTGIAASISGAFYQQGINLTQARLFSARNHGLALDFFHLDTEQKAADLERANLPSAIVEAIADKRYIDDQAEAVIPKVGSNITIESIADSLCRLRAEAAPEDAGSLIYYLTFKAFRQLGANVRGLAAQSGSKAAWVTVQLRLPEDLSLEQAEAEVASWET